MRAVPELVLVAVDEPMASAWDRVAEGRDWIRVHRGSVTDVTVTAVVSPANSLGWMRGGIDGMYARWLPGIEDRVRAAIAEEHGGELPVGQTVIVPTGAEPPAPAWLVSAPTMRRPGSRLDSAGEAAGLAARAVLLRWRDGRVPDGRPVRDVVESLALPGLGTGVGGLSPRICADRVAEAIDEVLGHTESSTSGTSIDTESSTSGTSIDTESSTSGTSIDTGSSTSAG